MSFVLFAVGLAIVLLTSASVLFTIVLPREPRGFQRLTTVVNRSVQLVFLALSRLAKTYEGKDSLLAPTAPVALLAQLLFWAICFVVGYGLMLEHTTHHLGGALIQAAGAVFTVGAVDLSGPANSAVDIAAGATSVLHNELLAEIFRQFPRHQAAKYIDRSAGRERDDDTDRSRRKGLSLSDPWQCQTRRGTCHRLQKLPTGNSHVIITSAVKSTKAARRSYRSSSPRD